MCRVSLPHRAYAATSFGKELCIELIYNNMLREMYAVLVENARRIAEAYESLMQKGETNRLEYNKATLNYATMENELKRIDLERERLTADCLVLVFLREC